MPCDFPVLFGWGGGFLHLPLGPPLRSPARWKQPAFQNCLPPDLRICPNADSGYRSRVSRALGIQGRGPSQETQGPGRYWEWLLIGSACWCHGDSGVCGPGFPREPRCSVGGGTFPTVGSPGSRTPRAAAETLNRAATPAEGALFAFFGAVSLSDVNLSLKKTLV